tara:strand:- start:1842 stop:2624 length:783 start_codon:yes stop_codon:yes gene_type:complete
MNKLTILMNCKNGENYLDHSLNSILEQTFEDWTLLFFDNQSTDNSKKIFDSYNDRRFNYFYSDKPLKLGEARKNAWKEINSKYVVICDVDDTFLNNRFEEQLKFMEENQNCSVVGSNVFLIDKNSNRINEVNHYLPSSELREKILSKHVFNSSTLFFRKKCVDEVGGYNSKYEMVNDYDLLFRLSKKFNIASLNRTLVCSRQHDNNLSFQKIVKGQVELIKLKMDILNSVKDINTKLKIYHSIIITLFRITYHSLRNLFK